MSELQIFKSEEFGEIRTVTIDNEPWLVGKDVAEALGYSEPRSAVSKKVDEADKGVAEMETPSGKQNMTIINESGLYALIFGSKLESAKRFKRWVTSEVLPSIRKNGGYISGQENMTDDELLEKAVLVAQRKIAERDAIIQKQSKQIEEMKPAKVFSDAVTVSKTAILIGELAKILKQNGVDIGEKRLFAWMRNHGYLIKRKGTDYNSPTQKSMDLGVLKVKETVITHSDGHTTVSKTTKVTGKGQIYFVNKFVRKKGD